jgi:hypothetical protein
MGVLRDQLLVRLELLPADVAGNMIAQQHVPRGGRLRMAGGFPGAPVDDACALDCAAEDIGTGIDRVPEDLAPDRSADGNYPQGIASSKPPSAGSITTCGTSPSTGADTGCRWTRIGHPAARQCPQDPPARTTAKNLFIAPGSTKAQPSHGAEHGRGKPRHESRPVVVGLPSEPAGKVVPALNRRAELIRQVSSAKISKQRRCGSIRLHASSRSRC